MVTTSLMAPDPDAAQELPAVALHVQVNPCPARPAGSGSLTLAPNASDGPELDTFTVYASRRPRTYGSGTTPLATARPTTGAGGTETAAWQSGSQTGMVSPEVGVTVTTFVSVPRTDAGTVPLTV